MAGLDPAIHVLVADLNEDVDARVKPGHDDGEKFPLELERDLQLPSNLNDTFTFAR